MAEMTGPERIAEVERQLKRLRAAAASVLLVGGTEDQVIECAQAGIAEVHNTMHGMAENNRRLVEEARAAHAA